MLHIWWTACAYSLLPSWFKGGATQRYSVELKAHRLLFSPGASLDIIKSSNLIAYVCQKSTEVSSGHHYGGQWRIDPPVSSSLPQHLNSSQFSVNNAPDIRSNGQAGYGPGDLKRLLGRIAVGTTYFASECTWPWTIFGRPVEPLTLERAQ